MDNYSCVSLKSKIDELISLLSQKDQRKIIHFELIRNKLKDNILNIAKKANIIEPVELVDGFVKQTFPLELSSAVLLGGPVIPMVMLLGSNSGMIYYFALKALLEIAF